MYKPSNNDSLLKEVLGQFYGLRSVACRHIYTKIENFELASIDTQNVKMTMV